jgi:phenylpyruvate tautomerase PptA (4-oxalocrotonate tautomerase family)
MPHIRMRAIEKEVVQKLSKSLIPDLAQMLNSPEDNFTLELVATEFFQQGNTITSYPFIEVSWFSRPQEVKDRVASLITDQVRALTNAADIIVVFQILNKSTYYENGKHF